ncbi:unnamed protein product [Leuciscus chuanchicus]
MEESEESEELSEVEEESEELSEVEEESEELSEVEEEHHLAVFMLGWEERLKTLVLLLLDRQQVLVLLLMKTGERLDDVRKWRISGEDHDHVFISSGENVRLPCNNALSDCKSKTTWIYNSIRHSVAAVELIAGGIKKKDTERHERLSLESDCSLNIKNVTEEDYGLYSCRQYVNGQKQGTDARVFLHVLHVSPSSSSSSSSSQTEISPGRSVTLSCQLYSDTGLSCDDLVSSEGVELLWVNQAGVDLKTDSRYQILSSSDQYHCIIITLTTTLLNEDNNREWRCQLTHRNQLQTSVRYTVKYSVDDTTVLGLIANNDETACKEETELLEAWCKQTSETSNIKRQIIVDYRKSNHLGHSPLNINGEAVERVNNFKFLGVTVSEDLSWGSSITSAVGNAQRRLFFLRKMKRAELHQSLMMHFYSCAIESVLTYGLTHNIMRDRFHPAHGLFRLLPSGRRSRSLQARTTRMANSLFPQAVIESVASQHLSAVSDAGRRCKVRGSPAEASPSPGWESALIRWILDNRPVDYT